MNEDQLEGIIRKFVSLFREHLDFLEQPGLTQEFNDWIDERYRDPDAIDDAET